MHGVEGGAAEEEAVLVVAADGAGVELHEASDDGGGVGPLADHVADGDEVVLLLVEIGLLEEGVEGRIHAVDVADDDEAALVLGGRDEGGGDGPDEGQIGEGRPHIAAVGHWEVGVVEGDVFRGDGLGGDGGGGVVRGHSLVVQQAGAAEIDA